MENNSLVFILDRCLQFLSVPKIITQNNHIRRRFKNIIFNWVSLHPTTHCFIVGLSLGGFKHFC